MGLVGGSDAAAPHLESLGSAKDVRNARQMLYNGSMRKTLHLDAVWLSLQLCVTTHLPVRTRTASKGKDDIIAT